MSKKVKSIEFELEFEGKGTFNFNGSDVTPAFRKTDDYDSSKRNFSNVMYGKRNYYKKDDSTLDVEVENIMAKYGLSKENAKSKVQPLIGVPKISSGCARSVTFPDTVNFDPDVMTHSNIGSTYLSATNGYLRGYMYTTGKGSNGYGRKSVVTITDLEAKDSVYGMDTCTKTGERSENSFFAKETLGETTYKADAFFDVATAQFLCLDQRFGKCSLDPAEYDDTGILGDAFKARFGRIPYEKGVYTNSASVFGEYYGVYGYRFDDEFINQLLNDFINDLWKFGTCAESHKAGGYVRIKSIKMRPVYDPIENNEEFIELKREDHDTYHFEYESFWKPANTKEWEEYQIKKDEIEKREKVEKEKEKKSKKEDDE